MNPTRNVAGKSSSDEKNSDGKLEKIANAVDPAGTDVSDEELMDPGAKTRDFPPPQKNSNTSPSRPK